jgi:hypothetical protein
MLGGAISGPRLVGCDHGQADRLNEVLDMMARTGASVPAERGLMVDGLVRLTVGEVARIAPRSSLPEPTHERLPATSDLPAAITVCTPSAAADLGCADCEWVPSEIGWQYVLECP